MIIVFDYDDNSDYDKLMSMTVMMMTMMMIMMRTMMMMMMMAMIREALIFFNVFHSKF